LIDCCLRRNAEVFCHEHDSLMRGVAAFVDQQRHRGRPSSTLLSCHLGSATAEIWRHIDFSRWRPRSLNTTSGFVIADVLAFRRSKSINDINGWHISIYGWDITTSGLEKQTSTILEFYFRFYLDHFPVICILFCISLPNFVQIGAATAEIWRHIALSRWRYWSAEIWCNIDFQDSGRQPCCICFGIMADHHEVPFVVWTLSSNCLLVGLIVPEILRFIDFGVLAWNCLFTPLLGSFWGIFSPYDVTHRPHPQRDRLWAETRHLSHSA